MCEPATLALAATAATVIGTGVSVYSSIQQGNAQAQAKDYQAAVDRNNAQVASWNAQAAEDSAAAKTQAEMRVGTQRMGAQRAALAAGGVTLDSGSALDVQGATAENTAIQTNATNYQGELTAYGYRTQQNSYINQAGLDEMSASNASTAGDLTAAGSFLSGAGQVANRWYAYNKGSGVGLGGTGNTGELY